MTLAILFIVPVIVNSHCSIHLVIHISAKSVINQNILSQVHTTDNAYGTLVGKEYVKIHSICNTKGQT